MFLIDILIALLLAVSVSANTEQLRFVFQSTQAPEELKIAGQLTDELNGLLGAFRSSHVQKINPSFAQSEEEYYWVNGIPGRSYEARVCWAASDPLEFKMEYLENLGLIKVSHSPDYYSHIPSLMVQPLPAKYDIVLNPILFGALPSDIMATIAQIVVCGVGMFLLSGHLVKYI